MGLKEGAALFRNGKIVISRRQETQQPRCKGASAIACKQTVVAWALLWACAARYLSLVRRTHCEQAPAAQDIEAGRAKAQVCAACHGADGNSSAGNFPNLAGQNWRYIYIQLKDFKEGRRNDPVMSPMAAALSREDMIDVANFYAAQPAQAVDLQGQ